MYGSTKQSDLCAPKSPGQDNSSAESKECKQGDYTDMKLEFDMNTANSLDEDSLSTLEFSHSGFKENMEQKPNEGVNFRKNLTLLQKMSRVKMVCANLAEVFLTMKVKS